MCHKRNVGNCTVGTNLGGADTAPGFLERLSEAMLQCYWRLAADWKQPVDIYIYIYTYNPFDTFFDRKRPYLG